MMGVRAVHGAAHIRPPSNGSLPPGLMRSLRILGIELRPREIVPALAFGALAALIAGRAVRPSLTRLASLPLSF